MSCPFVSVVVPVFNDAIRLRRCLQALAEQTYRSTQYEVIVIDNGSLSSEQIPAVVADFSFAEYVFEPVPGAYAARNRGLAVAKGDILSFTDADCIPAKDWIEKGVACLVANPDCGLVAGRIDLFFRGDRANPVELYESVTAFPQARLLAEQHGAATANVFTWKTVIETVGSFNSTLRSQGDLEWGQRVFEAGYRQIYAEEVCVSHPARYTFEQLRQRTVRLAGGAFGRRVQSESNRTQRSLRFATLLLEDLLPPVNFAISALKDSRLRGVREKLTVPIVLVWVRYVSAIEKVRLQLGSVPSRG
jgi:glycosyltransferase involved in cell wall biosynthesis